MILGFLCFTFLIDPQVEAVNDSSETVRLIVQRCNYRLEMNHINSTMVLCQKPNPLAIELRLRYTQARPMKMNRTNNPVPRRLCHGLNRASLVDPAREERLPFHLPEYPKTTWIYS